MGDCLTVVHHGAGDACDLGPFYMARLLSFPILLLPFVLENCLMSGAVAQSFWNLARYMDVVYVPVHRKVSRLIRGMYRPAHILTI